MIDSANEIHSGDLKGVLQLSSDSLKKLVRIEFFEKYSVSIAFYFFVSVCFYIIDRRTRIIVCMWKLIWWILAGAFSSSWKAASLNEEARESGIL
jgi:hypothetical protein